MLSALRYLLVPACVIVGLGACSSPAEEEPDASDTDATDVPTAEDAGDTRSDPDGAEDTAADTARPDVPVTPIDHYIGAGVDLDTLDRSGQSLTDLNLAPLTHLSIGYARLAESGICTLSEDHAAAIQELRGTNPSATLLLTVGGYTNSTNFSEVAATPQARALFASSCAALVDDNGFDGLEVDWSQPVLGALPDFNGEPDDWANYQMLLESTRTELDTIDQDLLLTMVGPADLTETPAGELTAAVDEVDIVTLVTYDFAGPWSSLTDLSAAVYRRTDGFGFSVNLVVSAWMEAGVPASKLVVGYPLYGWGWAGIDAEEIGANSTGFAPGSDADDGVYTWDALRDSVIPNADRYWEETAQGVWAITADGIFLSYDDFQAVEAKADYVLENGLRGLSGWSLGSDLRAELPSVARAALSSSE